MPSLTRAEATARRASITVESYDVDLDLTGDAERFRSAVTIRFRATPGAETFVDVKPRRLLAARLNDSDLDPALLADGRLPLTGLAADNTLTVEAEMAYSNTGEGLHRFVDPADGETYLYAMSFLDDGPRIFAAFDQPDLKAPVTLTVTAPPEWTVAANGPLADRPAPGRWEFATTEPLATYFVSLIAGPWHVLRAEHDGIPLGLYCRRSLAEHLDADADEIFTVTRQCFDRFHELFAERYPFGKYDQAFVPEFNAGAMENPGLVTIRDDYVFRSAVTDTQRELRATTIAHEMAHMWFGDLVTMSWWDDLWLNESFAEYLGTRVTAEATRFDRAWTTFASRRKAWGYTADQRPSTHPVAPEEVADAAPAILARPSDGGDTGWRPALELALGQSLVETDQTAEAVPHLERGLLLQSAVRRAPGGSTVPESADAKFRHLLGWAYADTGRTAQARREYRRVLDTPGLDPDVRSRVEASLDALH